MASSRSGNPDGTRKGFRTGKTFFPNSNSLGIFLLITVEKVDPVILVGGWVGLSSIRPICSVGLCGIARKLGELVCERGNMKKLERALVRYVCRDQHAKYPAAGVRELGGVGKGLDRIEDAHVGLRRRIAI